MILLRSSTKSIDRYAAKLPAIYLNDKYLYSIEHDKDNNNEFQSVRSKERLRLVLSGIVSKISDIANDSIIICFSVISCDG